MLVVHFNAVTHTLSYSQVTLFNSHFLYWHFSVDFYSVNIYFEEQYSGEYFSVIIDIFSFRRFLSDVPRWCTTFLSHMIEQEGYHFDCRIYWIIDTSKSIYEENMAFLNRITFHFVSTNLISLLFLYYGRLNEYFSVHWMPENLIKANELCKRTLTIGLLWWNWFEIYIFMLKTFFQ